MYRFVLRVLAIAMLPVVGCGAAELKIGGTGASLGLLKQLGEEFSKTYPGDRLVVFPGLGSSGGILAAAEGALDFAMSSRTLKADEKARGLDILPVLDTPFVFISSHPQPQKLTRSDVIAIYDGALATWPDGKHIKLVLRPKSDSTTDFLNANFEGMQRALEKLRQRPDLPVAATDQDNTDAAEGIANSFSGATLLQLLTEKPKLRQITLDGIEASTATMENGSYPLKMRLYIVMKSGSSPPARRFLDFLNSTQAEKIFRDNGAARVTARSAL